MEPLKTIQRTSVAGEVAKQLRQLIEHGGYSSGDRLPSEAQLTERLGVSRNVLREALGRLESLGMVRVRRGHGMFVGDRDGLAACAKLARSVLAVSCADLTQVAELRVAVECHAARKAAERATPEQIEQLQAAMEEIAREGLSDEESIRADWDFHMKLIEIGCGHLLVNLMAVIQEFLIAGIQEALEPPLTWVRRMRSHQPIMDALRAADPITAERACREHVEGWYERLRTRSLEQGEDEARTEECG